MASALTVLFLGCWLAGRSGVSGEGSLTQPSISVSPSGVIPVGGNVIIWCRHQRLGLRFLLYKAGDGNYLNYTDPAGSEAEFPITSARREHGGNYTCRYSNRTGPAAYSEPSDPVQIIVAELSYPKPSISRSPSGEVTPGRAVTIRCRGSYQNVRFLLYKDGNPNALRDAEHVGDVAEFPIHSVSWRDAGNYSCYYHHKSDPPIWSHPSDPMELVVAEVSYTKPSISVSPGGVIPVGGNVTIRCRNQQQGMRFLLYKDGNGNYSTYTDPAGSEAEFPITSARREQSGNYTCRYSNRTGPAAYSEPSDPVQIIVAEGTDPTQPGMAPAPTCSGSARPSTRAGSTKSPSTPPETEGTDPAGSQQPDPPTTEPEGEGRTDPTQSGTTAAPTHPGSARPGGSVSSAAPVLTRPIIAGVSAASAGLLLLLLLLAFVCYRRTRGRKGPAPRQSRESEAAATVYALMGEGKQLNVLPQEPDPGAEGLTYAELDRQALQAKRGGPAPAPEPLLYATINVSQGPEG